MDLSKLTNDEVLNNLGSLNGKERRVTLSILHYLNELDRRALFRELGYSNLFDYCTRKLGYSAGSAQRRIVGARCLRDHPELGEMILRGEVTLCSISLAAQGLKKELIPVAELAGKSAREVERLVAEVQPVVKKKETIRSVFIKAPESPLLKPEPVEERYSISFSVTKEVYEQFEQAKNQLSHKLGGSLTVEAVFGKLLEHYLKPPVRASKLSSDTRYIPKAVKSIVRERDEGRCSYVSPDGTRCSCKTYLHFDHIVPFAKGGKTDSRNLRLLCPAHNQLHAEKCFGISAA